MDWRIVGTTFLLIFVAELGDKTQLAVFARTLETRAAWSVFLGAAAALVTSTILAVIIGGALTKLPDKVNIGIKVVAGLMFIGFGVWTFVDLFLSRK